MRKKNVIREVRLVLVLLCAAVFCGSTSCGTVSVSTSTTGSSQSSSPANVVALTDSPQSIYTKIENAQCGDTIKIQGGTYSHANGELELIHIAGKNCTASNPIVIEAADATNKPLFDYTGTPLDGPCNSDGSGQGTNFPLSTARSYDGGDYNRGAWQIVGSSYVTIDGIQIKGATACSATSISGIRLISSSSGAPDDNITIRNSVFQQNWSGLFGNATHLLIELNRFLGNGNPSEDQEHNLYIGNGDEITVRYNYFNGSTCCIQASGTTVSGGGGQNIHMRAWHSYIYGNWQQDGDDYEIDTYIPSDTVFALSEHTDQYVQYYNNVFISSANPQNPGKAWAVISGPSGQATTMAVSNGGSGYVVGDIVTLASCSSGFGDGAATANVAAVASGVVTAVSVVNPGNNYLQSTPTNSAPCSTNGGHGTGLSLQVTGINQNVTQHIDADWNTFYLRKSTGSYPGNIAPNYIGGQYALYQFVVDTTTVGAINLHFANNVVHFAPITDAASKDSLFLLSGSGPITAAGITSGNAGNGYANGDIVTLPANCNGSGFGDGTATGMLTVTGGVPTGIGIISGGRGYIPQGNCAVTGGTGTGLQVDYLTVALQSWNVTGDNNSFDSTAINTTSFAGSNGTLGLTNGNTVSPLAPPFINLGALDLRPNSLGVFGSADTLQTLQSPQEQYAPFAFAPRNTYTNPGALQ